MSDDGPGIRVWLPWLCALVAFAIALPTVAEVLDVGTAAVPLVAAAAAVPLGLIATQPALGWLLSATGALLVSRQFSVVDGDPWPWPIVHGLVLLALLFAVGLRPVPRASRALGLAMTATATAATALLFAASVPDDLRPAWAVGAAAVGVAGVLVRLTGLRAAPPVTGTTVPLEAVPALLLGGFRVVFLDWRPAAPAAVPAWVRRIVPWLAAFVVFSLSVGTVEETLLVHPLLVPLLGALMALPVGLVERYPLVGWRLATVLAVVLAVVGTPSDGDFPGTWPVIFQWAWLASAFFVGVRYDRWTTICAWATTVAALSAGVPDDSGTVITLVVALTALMIIGDLWRSRRRTSRDLERQTELSELEKARRTVLEERTRIARDLHDVVAHHMSMVVVQAETAPYRLADLPEDAKAEFATISASARKALDEIRGLLGVLRSDDRAVVLAPQPSLDQLGELVQSARRSGVAVELATAGTPADVPATVSLSAFRIVQEALANAARHAPGTDVTVEVTYDRRAVNVHVVNGAPHVPVAAGPPGHGLIGMRERATVVGGTLEAAATPGGGFAVTAVLPYQTEEPTT